MSFLQTFTRFSGRLGRSQFWTAVAMWGLLALSLLVMFSFFELTADPPAYLDDPPMPDPTYKPPEFFAIMLGLFYPLLAISVKRLHDRSKSGWWSVPTTVAPMLILFFALPPWHRGEGWSYDDPWQGFTWSPPELWIGLILGALVLLAWWVVELGMRPGTPGANRYGPAEYPAIGSARSKPADK